MNEIKEHQVNLDSTEKNLKIRKMSLNEVKLAMDWAKDEGWNPGRYDYIAYYHQDPKGFLVLCLNDQPIGSISIVKHNSNFAFIGLFIVIPEHRGQGYGTLLWNRALNDLKDFSSVGLYSVPEQKSRYNKFGFFSYCSVKRQQITELPNIQASNNHHLETINRDNLDTLSNYDAQMWGSSRAPFFATLFEQSKDCYGFISFGKDSNEINGYGIARPCQEGFRVSLYAKSFSSAQDLASHLLSCLKPGSKVIFDIPERNPFSEAFAEFFNLSFIDTASTETMFKGEEVNTSSNNCYGLLSLELG